MSQKPDIIKYTLEFWDAVDNTPYAMRCSISTPVPREGDVLRLVDSTRWKVRWVEWDYCKAGGRDALIVRVFIARLP